MTEATRTPAGTPPAQDRSDNPYAHLPEPIRIADTTASHPASPPPDPYEGRNPDQDAALHAGG